MANDKDFIVKNAVEVGGPTNVTLGTVTSNNIDLATGNYFKDTPSGTSTYSISNAGDVQSFQLELTGGTEAVAQNFSTTLYTGNSSTQTITNGIDLAGDGGLVWIKNRSVGSTNHSIFDTESGATGGTRLRTNLSNGLQTFNGSAVFTTSSTGFALNNDASNDLNDSIYNYVSWTFKKEPSFFDVVTWTGDGTTSRSISHNLGSAPGSIFIKQTSGDGENWIVWHRSISNEVGGEILYLNATDSQSSMNGKFDDTNLPTSTTFTVEQDNSVNASGASYVAYLFAHDTASDSQIKCGSYTGTGSDLNINLGWQPQFVIIKNYTNAYNWQMHDSQRGVTTDGNDARLHPNLSNSESTDADWLDFTSTGMTIKGSLGANLNSSGHGYIYIAIRAASDLDLTWPTSIEFAGGVAPAAPATGETDVFTFSTDDGGTSYIGTKTADNLS